MAVLSAPEEADEPRPGQRDDPADAQSRAAAQNQAREAEVVHQLHGNQRNFGAARATDDECEAEQNRRTGAVHPGHEADSLFTQNGEVTHDQHEMLAWSRVLSIVDHSLFIKRLRKLLVG